MGAKKHRLEEGDIKAGFITKASARYCEKFPLRAAIQGIPGVGSSLDTMLAGLGAKYQYERLEGFICSLKGKLSRVEQLGNFKEMGASEGLFDFLMETFDEVIRARSEKKREWFANLVARQVINKADWDEAEAALRLIGELSDIHIEVVDVSLKAEPCDGPFEGLRLVTTSDEWLSRGAYKNATDLRTRFPALSEVAFRMIISGLVSRGLLYDEGIGRYGSAPSMTLLVATDLAKWLMDWICEIGKESESAV